MSKIHWLGTGLSAIPGLKMLIEKGYSVVVYNRTIENATKALSGIKGEILFTNSMFFKFFWSFDVYSCTLWQRIILATYME